MDDRRTTDDDEDGGAQADPGRNAAPGRRDTVHPRDWKPPVEPRFRSEDLPSSSALFATPTCLTPDEVDHLLEGTLSTDRRGHVEDCPYCSRLADVVATYPANLPA